MADHTENGLSSSPCREDVKLPGSLAPPGTGVIHTGNVTYRYWYPTYENTVLVSIVVVKEMCGFNGGRLSVRSLFN